MVYLIMWKKDTDDSAIGNPAMARVVAQADKTIRTEVARDGFRGREAEEEFDVRYANWLVEHRPRKSVAGLYRSLD